MTDVAAEQRGRLTATEPAPRARASSDAGAPEPKGAGRRSLSLLPVIVTVAVAASGIVIGALSRIGDTWHVIGDPAGNLFRVSQVGTWDTPLVGAETVKGWAHPGPLGFYLANPLHRLTDGDPRSMVWTAAIVNVVAVGGIALVAWRRGRWPLLLGLATMVALLVNGVNPERLTSLWNPYLPLVPFLLTVVLVWDVALGNRRALPWAALSATLAAQNHIAFVSLGVVLAAWLFAWSLWWPRLLGSPPGDDPPTATLPAPWLRGWWRPRWLALAAVAVLWLPPFLDALFGLHNPLYIVNSLATPPETVGPLDAIGIVGRNMRPDGPWMGGAEPAPFFSVLGSGPLPLLAALVLLGGCLHLGRRRGFVDVVALASLVLTLIAGSIPATSQLFLPAYPYLTQFLKLVGGLVWFTVAWTAWRVAEPYVRAGRVRVVAVASIATVGLVVSATLSWGAAVDIETPHPEQEALVQDVRAELDDLLPRDERIRVEYRGEGFNVAGPGLIYWLIRDGFDVVTADGGHGLKWGHDHRWQTREDYDRLLTVAVQDVYSPYDAFTQCQGERYTELVASADTLSRDERRWLDDFLARNLFDPSEVSEQERRRADRLHMEGSRIGVFEGPRICAREPATASERREHRIADGATTQ